MARPIKDGMDYFPHDTDAANDEKIEALRALYGNDGYAFFFIVLERIYRSAGAEFDVSKPAVLAALIAKVGVSKDKFNDMLETAFDIECLDREAYETRKVLTSNGVKRRASEVNSMREKWRKNKGKRAENKAENVEENPVENTVENRVENQGENAEETRESKEKKSKGKESKLNTIDDDNARAEIAEIVKEIQKIKPISNDTDCDFVNELIDNYPRDWLIEAIRIAVKNKADSYGYVRKTVHNWRAKGYKDTEKPWEVEQRGKPIFKTSAKARDQDPDYSEYN